MNVTMPTSQQLRSLRTCSPGVNSTICIATANGGNSLGEEHLLACYVTGPFDVSYVPDNVSYHRHS